MPARPTVAELLGRVRATALAAYDHQDLPFEQVVERLQPARSLATTRCSRCMFALAERAGRREAALELPGLALAAGAPRRTPTAKFDLALDLHGGGRGRIVGALHICNGACSIARRSSGYVGYCRRCCEAMVADEPERSARLPLMRRESAAGALREWNAPDVAVPGESCVHELFEAQAARTPHAIALVVEDEHARLCASSTARPTGWRIACALGRGPGRSSWRCALERSPGARDRGCWPC